MSRATSRTGQDQRILDLLDGDTEGLLAEQSEKSAESDRAYLETFGLLAYDAEPQEPPPELKAKILSALTARGAEVLPASDNASAAARRRQRRLLPLAATLAVLVIGASFWQAWRSEQQAETIVRLSEELERLRATTRELQSLGELAAETRARLEVVTAATAEYCALRPTSESAFPQAWGILVMTGGGSDWYLRIEGLGEDDVRREYQLWFVTASGRKLGSRFAVEGSGDVVEIRAQGVPEGTESVVITMGPADPGEDGRPRPVLYGDQRMRVL